MRMAILACFLLTSIPALASQDRVIGLLTLPAVYGDGPYQKFQPRDVALYPEPDAEQATGTLRVDRYWTFPEAGGCKGLVVNAHTAQGENVNELPSAEYDYESPAAIVLQARDPWFKVRLAGGAAWLKAQEKSEYFPLEALLMNGLTYIATAPDVQLSDHPRALAGAGEDDKTASTGDEVRVVEFIEAENELWIHIEVMSHSICEPGEEPMVTARGWLPAYGPSAEPTIWFRSRGC